jgi:glycosyltransferase involved in cell wall biosynthesis
MVNSRQMKVAFIHDWLNGMRGGEKILEAMLDLFPEAEIFTLFHVPHSVSKKINARRIHTSFLQRLPFSRSHYRYYLPLYPRAVEQFSLAGFDLVISISHCAAKSAMVPEQATHMCYCLSPMRYIWDQYEAYFGGKRAVSVGALLMPLFRDRLRRWDVDTAQRVDSFLAISQHIANKIHNYYGRTAEVIHPPVDTDFFVPSNKDGDYFLVVSAMVPYKKIELAVETFNQCGLPLVVVGKGPERRRLQARAKANIRFRGWVSNEELAQLYAECRALVFPGEEDFGLVPLEAQSCGRPVIAFRAGGVLESVIEGETGIFFDSQDTASLKRALDSFKSARFEKEIIRRNALRFSKTVFMEKMKAAISARLQ